MASGCTPPRAARLLLRVLLGARTGEIVVGDIDEEFFDTILPRHGPMAARRWYWHQTLASIRSVWRGTLSRRGRSHVRVADVCSTGSPRSGALKNSRVPMASMILGFRYSWRSIRRRPGFAATVIALVALGVGATTSVFSIVDGVVLRKLPYPSPNELVCFGNQVFPLPFVAPLNERTHSLTTVAAVSTELLELAGDPPPIHVHASYVTPGLFSTLGLSQVHGRLFLDEDFDGPARVAVVGHRLFQNRWGGDDAVIGRTVTVGGQQLTVVGVLPSGFQSPEAVVGGEVDVWIPYNRFYESPEDFSYALVSVVARLRDGVTREAAQLELNALSAELAAEYPAEYSHYEAHAEDHGSAFVIRSLHDATVGDVDTTLYMFLGAVGLLLLIACANVANMFLARVNERELEMALRSALGAGKLRIVSRLLTESVTLSLIGGALGVCLAHLGVFAFKMLNPGGIPRIQDVSLDWRVLSIATLVSLLTGVVFGILPALHAARVDLSEAMKCVASNSTSGRGRYLLRDATVTFEVALTLVLLSSAGLLFNSFIRLSNVDVGFDATDVTAVHLSVGHRFTEEENTRFTQQLLDRVSGIPGVDAVAAGVTLPFGVRGGGPCCWFRRVRNLDESRGYGHETVVTAVTPGFFQVLGSRVLQGRGFVETDNSSGEDAPIVLTASLARRLFGNENAVGRSFFMDEERRLVVGVVSDVRHWSLRTAQHPGVYIPFYGPIHTHQIHLAVKSDAALSLLAPQLRAAVWDVDPSLPVFEITPLEQLVRQSVAGLRLYSTLLIWFAIAAVVVAAGGVYGSMLYAVGRRRREMGIRLALGARNINVKAMIVRHALALAAIGVAFGLTGAITASRLLEGVVFDISPTDPMTLLAVTVLMIAVAVSAAYLPARKAAGADPTETLRAE